MTDVRVIVGPGVVADEVLLREVAESEFAACGIRGSLVHAKDSTEIRQRCATQDGLAVVIPGPEARELIEEPLGEIVWLDLDRRDGVRVGEGAAHLHGRGIGGLTWAIRHAVHRHRHPAERIAYGAHPDQWGELRLPARPGPHPVVALVHGGYWRAIWAADLMDALAVDLVERGFAVWNLEYRRPDLHGWPATTEDVSAGLAALSEAGDGALDLDRVGVVGHSAGAQLALRAAADGARVALAVSLAGVLDLVEADRRWMSSGAVAAALGGTHDGDARLYGEASPLLRLPLKVRQLVVQGSGDDLDLVDFSRRYARAARDAGDDLTYLEMSGDHFAVISPTAPIWRTTALAIADALQRH